MVAYESCAVKGDTLYKRCNRNRCKSHLHRFSHTKLAAQAQNALIRAPVYLSFSRPTDPLRMVL